MENLKQTFQKLGFSYDEDSLKENYKDALKDSTFKELVSSLEIPIEELIKRTTTITECSLELKNCKKCRSILECKNKMTGYCYLPMVYNKELVFNYQACKYKKEFDNNNRYQENIYLFEIPKEIKNAKMADIYLKDVNRVPVIKWLKDFIKNYNETTTKKGLYLNGNFGCGKTYLISAMFNEMAKKNVKVAIIYFPEFLRNLKSSFTTDFEEKYEYVKKVPLLLLDDIGAENLTPWGRDEILGTILQYRMQEGKPTFFTSNLNLQELEEHFAITKSGSEEVKAQRLIERIKQLTDNIEYIGENLRG